MSNWSFDILRQSNWDWWSWICIVACVVLLSYAVVGRIWSSANRWLGGGFILAGLAGTVLVLTVPALRSAGVGLVWTFVLLGLLSATFYLNLLPQLGRRRMGLLLGLRIAALALLVPMLFEPVLRFVTVPRPTRPLLVLVDTSGSMSFPDVQNGPTRLQSVWQSLQPQLEKIDAHFIPHFFTFDSRLRELSDAQSLATAAADGQSTDIAGAVAQALATTPRTDTGVILISDGIDNTSADVRALVRAAGRAVNTVQVGSAQSEPATMANIAVDNLETTDDFVVGHESAIRATIKSSALADRVVEVKLAQIDAQGQVTGSVTSKPLVLQPLPQGQTVELAYKPEKIGVQRLAVWVDPVPGERSVVDNRQEYQGLALDPRLSVLYIEGRARPEYRDLNRALGRDANIDSATLLRITHDRFAASGSVDGQPFTQMPQTLEEWKKFDVIIIGDLDVSFITPDQQRAIEQAVGDGAGLMMIGGQNSFGPGHYQGTPIEQVLPVFVGPADSPQEKSEFVPQLTEQGQLHPALQGLARWFSAGPTSQPSAVVAGDDASTQNVAAQGMTAAPVEPARLPPLRGNVVVEKAKSAAQVLLIHAGVTGPDGNPQIILATQPYGRGRSAAFTADTTYLWYLPLRGMGQDSPYNRLWGQLIRWLAGADVKNRDRGAGIEALLNKNVYQLGESIQLRSMVRDARGDATSYAQVSARLSRVDTAGVAGGREQSNPPDGSATAGSNNSTLQLPLTPSASRMGLYELTLPHPDQGQWQLELVASKDGQELGRQSLRFTVIPPADEMLKIAANAELLQEMATDTNGYHYSLAQLPVLIDQLIRQDAGSVTSQQRSIPLNNLLRMMAGVVGYVPEWPRRYDLPTQAALIVVLLAGEWILRRRWQLP
ncbi:MAG: VWA domain-containing protein [Phycisphaerales bacterium]|nr:VWA domain-containing protein [Phycisphaerales bacterium]